MKVIIVGDVKYLCVVCIDLYVLCMLGVGEICVCGL